MTMNGSAAGLLRDHVEALEALNLKRAEIDTQIAERKRAAKNDGFDVPTITRILRARKLTPTEAQEREALFDIYRAALGMLYDTPLGEAARKRLAKPPEPKQADPEFPDGKAPADPPLEPPPPPPTADDLNAARADGRTAAAGGRTIVENPFAATDARRAAWDEGWCEASGTDGMEIPAAWKRTPKPSTDKPAEPKPGEA